MKAESPLLTIQFPMLTTFLSTGRLHLQRTCMFVFIPSAPPPPRGPSPSTGEKANGREEGFPGEIALWTKFTGHVSILELKTIE